MRNLVSESYFYGINLRTELMENVKLALSLSKKVEQRSLEESIKVKPKAIWMQLGVINEEAGKNSLEFPEKKTR